MKSPTRVTAGIMRIGLPAFSLVATILSLGYFGAFDYPYRLATNLPPTKSGPTQKKRNVWCRTKSWVA
jgi:hypothetical protein